MRVSRTTCVSLLSATAFAATALLATGSGAAQAATGPNCSITQETTDETSDHYFLTNLQVAYPHAAPPINKWAQYFLADEPKGYDGKGCDGQEYFVTNTRGNVIPLVSGARSTSNWSDVGFKLPAGVTFAEVHYGDVNRPWDDYSFIASVSRLSP